LRHLFPEVQQAVKSHANSIQIGGQSYLNSVLNGSDEVAKRLLIITVAEMQPTAYYASLVPALSSPDLTTRLTLISVYQQVPLTYLAPIQPALSSACDAEPDPVLKSWLSALLSSLGN
jgi:hypothetical protein